MNELVRSELVSDRALTLCEGALEMIVEGVRMKFEPNETLAYLEGAISHSFPVVTVYGCALHAGTVLNSYRSLLRQVFNRDHRMAEYYKGTPEEDKVREDWIIGCVAGVEFHKPATGLSLGALMKNGPVGIRIVNNVFKSAKGVDNLLGKYQAGRQPFTLSMEVTWHKSESGFAIFPVDDSTTGKPDVSKEFQASIDQYAPDDFKASGFGYVPWAEAEPELLATFSNEKNSVVKAWRGRRVAVLMGGIDGSVHYGGVAMVKYGAEPTAAISQLLASDPLTALGDGMRKLKEIFCEG